MSSHWEKLGRTLVAIFFIFSFSNLSMPTYAEDETPITPDIPTEPSNDSGDEWNGDIVDPTPTPTPAPTPTPTPTPTPGGETPSSIVSTGPEGVMAVALGAGGVTTLVGYTIASRRKF